MYSILTFSRYYFIFNAPSESKLQSGNTKMTINFSSNSESESKSVTEVDVPCFLYIY